MTTQKGGISQRRRKQKPTQTVHTHTHTNTHTTHKPTHSTHTQVGGEANVSRKVKVKQDREQ